MSHLLTSCRPGIQLLKNHNGLESSSRDCFCEPNHGTSILFFRPKKKSPSNYIASFFQPAGDANRPNKANSSKNRAFYVTQRKCDDCDNDGPEENTIRFHFQVAPGHSNR